MIKSKSARVAFGALISRSIKLLSAPITLIIISKQLSSEEMAFYYTFFSLVSMQQLAEMGIGHVIRQHISHAFKTENGRWLTESIKEIKEYFYFSLLWFLCVSSFILCVVGSSGWWYLNLNETVINWKLPWICLVVSSSILTLLSPLKILLDGTQKQEHLIKSNLISGTVSCIALWVSMSLDADLYSISISTIVTAIVGFWFVRKPVNETIKDIKTIEHSFKYKDVLSRVWVLLKNVSLVWAFGFLFWNAFNLVSFQVFEISYAGKIVFAVALARAGFTIAESITQSQMSIFSNMISNGKQDLARKSFSKYSVTSLIILITGYSIFIGVWLALPEYYLFDKLPEPFTVIQVFVFFTILLYKTVRNNFVRCFKIEPFVKVSMFESVMLPMVFAISTIWFTDVSFLICSVLITICLIISIKIEKDLK